MEPETTRLEASDGTALCLYRWDPASGRKPVAALHIAHGMGEHSLRYARFAAALTARGIAVHAHDHRGHGRSVTSEKELGVFGPDGWNQLVRDLSAVHEVVRKAHPGLPFVAFGHSMGSFALQQLLLDESRSLTAAALCGSAALDPVAGTLDTAEPISLEVFNAPFAPARTGFEWLSRDEAEVDAYVADPLCGFGVDGEATGNLAAAGTRLADPAALRGIRPDLPLYIMAGSVDPVNQGLAALDRLVERYRDAGLAAVTVRTYEDARHELLNETNREEVTQDFLDWLSGEGVLGLKGS